MNYAPIVLFCYKRPGTLKRCIASLQQCPESTKSDLVIIADAAATDSDIEKVMEVRQFLPSITGFKSIRVIERAKNLGVDYSIIEGIKMISASFGRFIVVEDDLVVAKDFLHFLNFSLDFYAANPEILTVTGFSFVDKIPVDYPYDGYFAKRTCPWGWATWSDKINKVDWEIKDKAQFLQSSKEQHLFNVWGSDRSSMLTKTLKGAIRAWDIRLDYYQFKSGLCTLYPVNTLVENIGFEGDDGSNTFGYNRFKTKMNFSSIQRLRLPDTIIYNKSISSNFIWKNSVLKRIHTRVMKMIGYKN